MKNIIILSIFMFLTSCDRETTTIPVVIKDTGIKGVYDPAFEAELIKNGIDEDNIINNSLLISNINQVTSLSFNTDIKSYKGLELFPELKSIILTQFSSLEKVDLSKNIKLESVFIGGTNSNKSKCIIDWSLTPSIKTIFLSKVEPSSFNFSKNINLESLIFDDIKSIYEVVDLSNTSIKTLSMSSYNGQTFGFKEITGLTNQQFESLQIVDVNFDKLDFENLKIKDLNLTNCNVKDLKLPKFNDDMNSLIIENCKNVREIDLGRTNVNILSLSKLNLEKFVLPKNPIIESLGLGEIEGINRLDLNKYSINKLGIKLNVDIFLPQNTIFNSFSIASSKVLSLNLKNYQIENLWIEGSSLKTIVLPKLEYLKSINLKDFSNSEILDFSNCTNLHSFALENGKLRKIVLPKSENLSIFTLVNESEVKELDLSFYKNLNYLNFVNLSQIKTIDVSSSNQISFINSKNNLNLLTIYLNSKQLINVNSGMGERLQKDKWTNWVVKK